MPDPAVTAQGIQAVLTLPDNGQRDLSSHCAAAARRLKQLIGATNYAALLVDTLEDDELDAATLAGQLLGASSYLRKMQPAASSRGVAMTVTTATGGVESFASAEQVMKMARSLRDQAILELKEAGLYQWPTNYNLTRIDVDEDDA